MEEKIIKLQKRADEIMNSKSINSLSDEKNSKLMYKSFIQKRQELIDELKNAKDKY